MQFLSSKRIYHGDLAARNILLTDDLDAKISDVGLSKRAYDDLPASKNLLKDDEESLPQMPIKWVAIEVLMKQEYVPIKSDVWSYGILIWEIFSGALEPYGIGKTAYFLCENISSILDFPKIQLGFFFIFIATYL